MYNFKENESLYATIVDTVTPTTSTEGVVGQFYIDQSTDPASLWLCTKVETVDSTTTYTWTKQGGKKLYQHNIALAIGATDIYSISGFAQIITNDNNSFTSETLLQWLKDNEYTSRSNMLNTVLMSKYVYSFNQELPTVFIGLYVSNNSFMSTALRTTLTLKEIAIIDNESISAYTDRTADLSSSNINVNVVYDTVTEL